MIRITVFADHDLKHSLAGGANVNLQENLKRLSSKFKITLLCAWEGGLSERERVDGVDILRFKGNMASLRWRIPLYFKRNLEKITDIVWDEVDSSVPWLTPLYTKKPILMHCLHFQKKNFFHELPVWKAGAAYLLEPQFYKLYRNHATVAISESTVDSLLEIGFKREKVHLVSPGLDPSVIAPLEEIKKKKSRKPLIVSLSRLRAWKGVHFAIQALKLVHVKVPDANLLIIGTGPYERNLRKLVSDLKLDGKVAFLGFLSANEKMEKLKEAHVLTKTSEREGWGIDVLEAGASLTPTVGWNVPGTKDSVRDGKTGFLVPRGDLESLAEKICKVLMDSKLRENLALEAYRFSQKFTWEESAKKIEKILTDLSKSGDPR